MSELSSKPILVAGHICLDVIPGFDSDLAIEPGRLVKIGIAILSTGGGSQHATRAAASGTNTCGWSEASATTCWAGCSG
ncbi:MAG: hypothetical protein ACOC3G_08520, partial [Phycisphaeraceae bacterium]